MKRLIEEVAPAPVAVLVRGESGVGKGLVARAIHRASARHMGPFVPINCAALPAELLESELFGHERGAFTGAFQHRPGLFERARGGTICLDEIAELPPALQAKLLHVVEDLQFSRVGGCEVIDADVRVVTTTNRDLEAAILDRQFRQDLYYRLNVVEIRVPPLREQPEAIPHLIAFFLARFQEREERRLTLSPATLDLFARYSWPGNIRELEHVLRRFVILKNPDDLQAELWRRQGATGHPVHPGSGPSSNGHAIGLKATARLAAREAERATLKAELDRLHWNRAEAARVLRVSYKTLLKKLVECGLAPPQSMSGNGPIDAGH